MASSPSKPGIPGQPSWDIRFSRLARAALPGVEACLGELARRFGAMGLGCERAVRPTPRGLSSFLGLIGPRGLICLLDVTLVDGRAVGREACAWLDVRLLDACGDVVAEGLAGSLRGRLRDEAAATALLAPEALDRAATALQIATLGHFDLSPGCVDQRQA